MARTRGLILIATGVFGFLLIATGVRVTTRGGAAGHTEHKDSRAWLLESRRAKRPPGALASHAAGATPGAAATAAAATADSTAAAAVATAVATAAADGTAAAASAADTAAADAASARTPVKLAGGCLITKWSAVWVVDATRKLRSHVTAPTPSCDLHASEVEDLAPYDKVNGGLGAYSLSEIDSSAACLLPGCFPRAGGAAATGAAGSAVGGSGRDDEVLRPPVLGWQMGVDPEWQSRSALRFNEAARRAFASPPPPQGEPLMLVFGGASVSDMLKNWAGHARVLGMGYAVACMDAALFDTANSMGVPAVMMKSVSAANGAVTTQWKYYRMDPKAFMQMGILKARFFMEFLRAGFDLLCSDLDVVWIADPRPWTSGTAAGSSLLPYADVAVSTDVTDSHNEHDSAMWGLLGELNTGVIVLRSTRAAMALCDEWIRRMQKEMKERPPPSGGFLQWWSNDQTFFNEVVHRAVPLKALELGLKDPKPDRRAAAAAHVRAATDPRSPRLARLERALTGMEQMHAARAAGQAAEAGRGVEAVRNVMFKRLGCAGCAEQKLVLSIATLPFEHFASGHTFFTQSLQERRGFLPACVHTTFQFGDTAEFTWGKRSRLREKRLWDVDEDVYFARKGTGTHPAEEGYEGFLQLDGELFDLAAIAGRAAGAATPKLPRSEASNAVKVEGFGAFVDRTLAQKWEDVLGMPERNPNRHLLLDSFQRRLVHDAMALGRALKRKVIMPRMMCWCDRFWNTMTECRLPGVSRAQLPFPFHCPFDHLYDLEKWVHSDAPFREYSFLNSSRVSEADRRDAVRLRVEGAADAEMAAGAERTLTLRPGDNYPAVGAALAAKQWAGAYVVHISARSLELLCEDLGSAKANAEFNTIMHTVLGVAEQVRYCDAGENPTYGRAGASAYDDYSNPINCTWGFTRPPLLPEGPSALGQLLPGTPPPPTCSRDLATIRAGRLAPPERVWNNPSRASGKRKQAWSTRDRPAYLQAKHQ